MEFVLSTEDYKNFILPVPPQEFTVQEGNNNQVVTVENIGEVNFIGTQRLKSITLSSFFPLQRYEFCVTKEFPKPYDCVKLIKGWSKDRKIITLNISATELAFTCCIESFSYGEKDGSGDVYFTLELKEYRRITTEERTERQVTKKPSEFYIVKSGDTLWAIAKRQYGDGSKWKIIAGKNGIKDPKKLQVGQRLVL